MLWSSLSSDGSYADSGCCSANKAISSPLRLPRTWPSSSSFLLLKSLLALDCEAMSTHLARDQCEREPNHKVPDRQLFDTAEITFGAEIQTIPWNPWTPSFQLQRHADHDPPAVINNASRWSISNVPARYVNTPRRL